MSTNNTPNGNYLEQFFPASAVTDEHQLTQLRLLAKRLRIASLPQIHGMLSGGHASKEKGRGLDLDQLRLYQPGDDIRAIDWRVTARTQKPHTRVYKEERERPVMILCDQRNPMFFGTKRSFKSVVAAQCAALIAWSALDHGDRIGAMVLGNQVELDFRPKQRAQHVLQILKAINECNHKLTEATQMTTSLSDGLLHLKQTMTPGTSLYIISDFYDLTEKDKEALFALRRHNHVVALQVFDSLEREAPPPGLYPVTDGEGHGILDTQNISTQKAYKEALSVWQNTIEHSFKHLGINHHQVDAGDIPFGALKVAIEQRGSR